MLHFEEALIDQRFSLPDVNILPDERIGNQFKHFTSRNGNIVPGLRFHMFSQGVTLDVVINLGPLISFIFVVSCTGETLHRHRTLT